jgi:adenine phosphoribosyltransferase
LRKKTVQIYSGETSYRVELGGIQRELPVIAISPHTWIASDAEFILGDVPFISAAARLLAPKVKERRAGVVLTAEAKSIALAYELSKRMGHPRFIVARKSLKSYMGQHAKQRLKSITTDSEQELVLTREEMSCLSGKRVCLLDDVVSTGGTFGALQKLVEEAGGQVVCKAAIWREGPWFTDPDLLFVDQLPVFVDHESPLAPQAGP